MAIETPTETASVDNGVLTEQELLWLEFLFDEPPRTIQLADASQQILEEGVAKIAHHVEIACANSPSVELVEVLLFSEYRGAAGALGDYTGPLFVWRNKDGELSVSIRLKEDPDHTFLPELRKLLADVMSPPATVYEHDMSLRFESWKYRIDINDMVYLWAREDFSQHIHPTISYSTHQEKFWAFLDFVLPHEDGASDGQKETLRYSLGVEVPDFRNQVVFHRYAPRVYIFQVRVQTFSDKFPLIERIPLGSIDHGEDIPKRAYEHVAKMVGLMKRAFV